MRDATFKYSFEDGMERRFDALREAEVLIDLVAAEFSSDPMSVQCFDLRIVERVKQCAATLRANPDPWASLKAQPKERGHG
jgi:hypothetical protein